MNRRVKLAAQVAAVGVVVALLAVFGWRLANRAEPAKGVAPSFTLPRLDGDGELAFESLRGKVVVVNFWASWCGPCTDEAPELEAAWQRWRSKGVVVLGIDAQDFAGDARRFVRRYDLTYPIVRDGPGDVVREFGVEGFPETFFVDRSGKIVGEHFQGPVERADLEANIRTALASA